MRRFFFNYQQPGGRLLDAEGEEFSGLSEAEHHAREVARELARNQNAADLESRAIVVEDEEGKEVARIPLNNPNENARLPASPQRRAH
jgi:hypothetical protein